MTAPVAWLVAELPAGRLEQPLYDRAYCIPRTRALWKALPSEHRAGASWSTRLPNPGKVDRETAEPEGSTS